MLSIIKIAKLKKSFESADSKYKYWNGRNGIFRVRFLNSIYLDIVIDLDSKLTPYTII